MSESAAPRLDVPIFNPVNYFGTTASNNIGANKADYPVCQGQERFPFGIQFGPDQTGDTYTQVSAYTGAATFGSSGGTQYQDATITLDDEGKITNISSGVAPVQYPLDVQFNGTTVLADPTVMNFVTSTTGAPDVVSVSGTEIRVEVPPCPTVSGSGISVPQCTNINFSNPNTTVTQSGSQAIVTVDGISVSQNGVGVIANVNEIDFSGADVTVSGSGSTANVTITPHTTQGYIPGLGQLYQYTFADSYTQNAGTINFITGNPINPSQSVTINTTGQYPFSLYFDKANWGAPPVLSNMNNLVVMAIDLQFNVYTEDNSSGNQVGYQYFYAKGIMYVNPFQWTSNNFAPGPTSYVTATPNFATAPTNWNFGFCSSFKEDNTSGATGFGEAAVSNNTLNYPGSLVGQDIFYFQGTADPNENGNFANAYFYQQVPSAGGQPDFSAFIPFAFPGANQPINSGYTRTTQYSCNVSFLQCPNATSILAPNFDPLGSSLSQINV